MTTVCVIPVAAAAGDTTVIWTTAQLLTHSPASPHTNRQTESAASLPPPTVQVEGHDAHSKGLCFKETLCESL